MAQPSGASCFGVQVEVAGLFAGRGIRGVRGSKCRAFEDQGLRDFGRLDLREVWDSQVMLGILAVTSLKWPGSMQHNAGLRV